MGLVAFSTFLLFVTSASADPMKVDLGDNVLLQSQAPRDAAIRLLEWIRPDLKSDGDVFFYRNERSYEKYQHPSYRGRVELKDPEMKDGDVSVVLKNVSMNDTGTYKCRIVVTITGGDTGTSSEQWHHVDLEVLGPGQNDNGGEGEQLYNDGLVGLVVLVAIVMTVFLLVVVGFMVFRKKRSKRPTYDPPPETELIRRPGKALLKPPVVVCQ